MTIQRIIPGDCIAGLRTLPDASVHCCVTSPPYWGLRDYGHEGQIGLESTPEAYVARMVEVFREVRRVLRDDGTLWLNLGDSYAAARGGTSMPAETLAGGVSGRGDTVAKRGRESGYTPHRDPAAHGLKHKDLVGIPWRVAFALQADGWWLRQDIIWHKPNPMPESVRDRCTKAHEYVFLLTKSERYFYDNDGISEPIAASSVERLSQPTLAMQAGSGRVPGKTNGTMKAVVRSSGNKARKPASARGVPVDTGSGTSGAVAGSVPWEGSTRNKRSVWTVTTRPFKGAHFAVMPSALVAPCILAGCPEGGTVLDPFAGSGTTLAVSAELGRNGIGCELNPEYIELANQRIKESRGKCPLFDGSVA
jgi:DNA modification methylase